MQASLTLLHIHVQERAHCVTILIEADMLPEATDETCSALFLRIVGDPSAQTLRAEFKDLRVEVVSCSFSLADEITAYAERRKTDLICIGANIHTKLHDILMGSVNAAQEAKAGVSTMRSTARPMLHRKRQVTAPCTKLL